MKKEFVLQMEFPDGVHWFENIVQKAMGKAGISAPFVMWTPYYDAAKKGDFKEMEDLRNNLPDAESASILPAGPDRETLTAHTYTVGGYMYMVRYWPSEKIAPGNVIMYISRDEKTPNHLMMFKIISMSGDNRLGDEWVLEPWPNGAEADRIVHKNEMERVTRLFVETRIPVSPGGHDAAVTA